MVIQYLVNKNNGKLYKAVNNSVLLMWYESRKDWGRCFTSYQDLFKGEYLDDFKNIDESDVERYK